MLSGYSAKIVQLEEIREYMEEHVPKHFEDSSGFEYAEYPNVDYVELAEDSIIWALLKGDAVVGYAVFKVGYDPSFSHITEAHNQLLYIQKDHRGVGLYFYRHVLQALGDAGIRFVYSSIYDDRMESLLTRLGFSPAYKTMRYDTNVKGI